MTRNRLISIRMGRYVRRSRCAIIGSLLCAFVLSGAAWADEDNGFEFFGGEFESQVVFQFPSGDPCPVSFPNICTLGVLRGALTGTFEFIMNDSESLGAFSFFQGESVINTVSGDKIFARDMGTLALRSDGQANFINNIMVTGGTGSYAHARGRIVASGILDLATQTTSGTYAGHLALPDDEDD